MAELNFSLTCINLVEILNRKAYSYPDVFQQLTGGNSMRITIIHGQNHKGSTYHIARMLAEKLGGEMKEFFCQRILILSVQGVPVVLEKMKNCVPIMKSLSQLHRLWIWRT